MAKKDEGNYDAATKVQLSIGDETQDAAVVTVTYSASYPDFGTRHSSALTVRVPLPEGSVLADPAKARKTAEAETGKVLRKMLASLR